MRTVVVTAGVLLGMLPNAPSESAPRTVPPDFRASVDAYVAAAEREGTVGGAVVLVTRDGVVASRVHGVADRATRVPVDGDTLFHWASMTKVFTAIAALQLVERGRLDLDAPVTRYLPSFAEVHPYRENGSPVRVRHLLTHSSGLRSATWPWNTDGAADRDDAQPLEPTEWSQIEAMFPYTGLQFEPGTHTEYSNLGFSVLGRIVELVAGESLPEYVDKNVLKPLGMTRTYFDATPAWLAAHRVHGYTVTNGTVVDRGAEVPTGATRANGGLNGPLSDLARFMQFLMGDPASYPVLRPDTLARMLTPQLPFATESRRTIQVGLGIFIADEIDASGATHRYVGHSGFQAGHRSAFLVSIDGCGGFAFAANTATRGGNPSAGALRARLADTVFPPLRTRCEGVRR